MEPEQLTAAALAIAIAILIAACGPTQLDHNWGRSVKSAAFHQTLNPEAQGETTPVEGLDGRAAAAAREQYHKSFTCPEKSGNITINLGGGK